MHFKIKEPYWKYKAVGLDENKLDEDNTVEILYKDVSGNLVYPGTYKISKTKAMFGRQHIVKKTRTKLRIVPIDQMEKI